MSRAEEWALKRFPVDMQIEPTFDGRLVEQDANRFKRNWAEKIYDEIRGDLYAEIEQLKSQLIKGACSSQIAMETSCKDEAYNEILELLKD